MAAQLERILVVLGLVLVLSPVTWRVCRFIVFDSLIEGPRERFIGWLSSRAGRVAPWLLKLYECPFCVSVWVAAGAVGLWCLVAWWWVGWLFIFVWLGAASGCMVLWRYIDPPPPCVPTEPCDEG